MKKLMSLVFALTLSVSLLSAITPVKAAELNWTNTNGVWTLNDDKGNLIKGWYEDANNCWYMLDWSTGAMKTGWVASGSDWYYMNPANGIMQTGWQKINGDWYYMQTSGSKAGAILTGTQFVDGVKQNFDESGKIINKGEPLRSHYKVLDDLVDEILAEIIKPSMSEREELRAIHDWICNNISYGGTGTVINYVDIGKRDDGKEDVPAWGTSNKAHFNYQHAYLTLSSQKGVCDGYVQAFNVLADALGYKTSVMQGQYDGNGHGVSLVWYDGEWLLMDCQLDDSVEGKILDIGFLKKYDNQSNFVYDGNYFEWNLPEDDFIQNARFNWEMNNRFEYESLQELIEVYS